jgi:hypothetical protein
MKRLSPFIFMLVSVSAQPLERCLVSRDGVECVTRDGAVISLTRSVRDQDPHISSDGFGVVLIRKAVAGDCTEIWTVDTRNQSPQPSLLFGGIVEYEGRKMCEFTSPMFGADRRVVYFLADFAMTSKLLVRLDTSSKSYSIVVPAISFAPVYCGRYKGDVVVQQRRVTLAGQYYYDFWLFSEDGREKGLVGRNRAELDEFLSQCR